MLMTSVRIDTGAGVVSVVGAGSMLVVGAGSVLVVGAGSVLVVELASGEVAAVVSAKWTVIRAGPSKFSVRLTVIETVGL